MAFVLPPKHEVGALSPELAAEWDDINKVIGNESFAPPPPEPVMPKWDQIKSIRHYFNRPKKYYTWPAMLYNHKTNETTIVGSAKEAAALGVSERVRTADEEARFGKGNVWEWDSEGAWRPFPKVAPRTYDPRKPEQGKEYVAAQIPQATANRDMLESALPAVTAAVVAALKQSGSVNPNNIDPKQWDKFLAFQAWEKTQEAIDVVTAPEPEINVAAEHAKAMEATMVLEGVPEEREAWLTEAKNRGIKVDGRWSLERIRSEVEKAA